MANIIQDLKRYPYANTNIKIKPTSGKQEGKVDLCSADIQQLQQILNLAIKQYDSFILLAIAEKAVIQEASNGGIGQALSLNSTASKVGSTVQSFLLSRITAAENAALRLLETVSKLCDPTTNTSSFTAPSMITSLDFGLITPQYLQYLKNMTTLGTDAAKIKINNQANSTTITVGGSDYSNKITSITPPDTKSFLKVQYEYQLYLIFPDNTSINIEQYVQQMAVTIDYDKYSSPIYSFMLSLPQNVYTNIKNHFENVKWFLNVKMFEKKSNRNGNEYQVGTVVKDHEEMLAVDPKFGPTNTSNNNPEDSVPLYPVKIDLIGSRDFRLNTYINAKVYNNCKLIDVISSLCNMVRQKYADSETDSKDQVEYTISPPDNKSVYEQIIIQPGTFTEVLQRLQLQYGVYKAGLRVSFDAHHTTTSGKIVKFFTVTEKSGIAPTNETFTDSLVEIVNPRLFKNTVHDYGFLLDKSSNTAIYRTFDNYDLVKANSKRIINGDNIRVMNSSQNSTNISICDSTSMNEHGTQRMFWSKYDNPYNLTQLQDHIREQNQSVTIMLRDVNFFSINDNINYNLKFYSDDDTIASGRYRLAKMHFYMNIGKGLSPKNRVDFEGALYFVNIPILRENGANVERPLYSSRVANVGSATTSSTSVPKPLSGMTSGNSSNDSIEVSAPFKTSFVGRTDFLGTIVPPKIPASYKMSDQVIFSEVYNGNNYLGQALASNFTLFVNAQRFSKEVIDPIYSSFGKKGLITFYQSQTDKSILSDFYVIALAANIQLGGKTGVQLAENFLKLVDSIEFDQIVLQGDGSDWKYVSISKMMNDSNRKQVILSPSNVVGDYVIPSADALTRFKADPKSLAFATYKKKL